MFQVRYFLQFLSSDRGQFMEVRVEQLIHFALMGQPPIDRDDPVAELQQAAAVIRIGDVLHQVW